MYGAYLVGQTNGLSNALSLQAVVAMFEIEGIAVEDRPTLTARFMRIHSILMDIMRRRESMKRGKRG